MGRLLLIGLLLLSHIVMGQLDIKQFRQLRKTRIPINVPNAFLRIPMAPTPVGTTITILLPGAISNQNLISDTAFSKLIKQDITFAVLGSQSPTPGFSLDISEKMSVKVTGLIPSKRKIVTLDLTAGSNKDQTNLPIFQDGKFNGQISAGINFHIIPNGTKSISEKIILGNTYPFKPGSPDLLKALKYIEEQKYHGPLLDTLAVLASYLQLMSPTVLHKAYDVITTNPQGQTVSCGIGAIEKAFPNIKTVGASFITTAMATGTRQYLFLKLASNYFPLEKDYKTLGVSALVPDLTGFTSWKIDLLYADIIRLSKAYLDNRQARLDEEIKRSVPYWLRKQLHWFTVSVKPVFYTLNTFRSNAQDRKVEVGSTNFLEFEAPLWYQFYDVRAKGGNLWRIGITPVLGTNRSKYNEVTYVSTDTVMHYSNDYVIKQTQKQGIYDDGKPREAKLYANYYLEFYRLPRRNFVPGLSLKLSYLKNAAFGEDIGRKLRMEIGAVLSLLNKEKNQSAITLQPYAAITNLGKEEIKQGDTNRSKTLAEKLDIGIRIGLPIRGQLATGK